ncbi:hypothetical protein LQW54_006632 [Pestalotiopsis sp. IQ-011]
MAPIERVHTDKAPKPLPQFSQAVKYNGMVYCSGNIGVDAASFKLVEGGVKEETRRALRNLSTVLEEAGSSINNVVKVNIFLTTMDNFATMNEAYDEFFTQDVKPLSYNSSPSRVYRRYASSSAAAEAKKENTTVRSEAVTTPLDATSTSSATLDPDVALSSTLNPPASTRPPPLTIPTRDPESSLFKYLFSVGKTYYGFYTSGLKAINTNRNLLKEVGHGLNAPPSLKDAADTKVRPTRAAVLLRERTRHDLSRLPVFALVLMVFGEFTPLVVLAFPKLTPYTCRIPKQIEKLRTNAQERRDASIRNIRHVTESSALDKIAPGHVVRCLDLASRIWDKAGIDPPFASAKASKAISRIVTDDAMIRDGGGVNALEPDEVILACEDRAFDVRSADVETLRKGLAKWIEATSKTEGAGSEAVVSKMLIGLDTETK